MRDNKPIEEVHSIDSKVVDNECINNFKEEEKNKENNIEQNVVPFEKFYQTKRKSSNIIKLIFCMFVVGILLFEKQVMINLVINSELYLSTICFLVIPLCMIVFRKKYKRLRIKLFPYTLWKNKFLRILAVAINTFFYFCLSCLLIAAGDQWIDEFSWKDKALNLIVDFSLIAYMFFLYIVVTNFAYCRDKLPGFHKKKKIKSFFVIYGYLVIFTLLIGSIDGICTEHYSREYVVYLEKKRAISVAEAEQAKAEKERKKAEIAAAKLKAKKEKEKKKKQEEQAKKEAEEKRKQEEEQAKKEAEEKRKQEEEQAKKEAEEKRKQEEEQAKKEAEEKRKQEEAQVEKEKLEKNQIKAQLLHEFSYPLSSLKVNENWIYSVDAQSQDELKLALYTGMLNRKEQIAVYYYGSISMETLEKMIEEVNYYDNTETANDADYLHHEIKYMSYSMEQSPWLTIINVEIDYWDNASMQKQVDSKVSNALATLQLSEKNDYEKVKAVEDWIKNNLTYDDSMIDHSAYGGMEYGYTVCQGYALITYKMLTEAGIETRIIVGNADNGQEIGRHAWNIVSIDGNWYYLDTTWDDCLDDYRYFLLGEEDMAKDHFPDEEYTTELFEKYYTMSENCYPERPETKSNGRKGLGKILDFGESILNWFD